MSYCWRVPLLLFVLLLTACTVLSADDTHDLVNLER